jgi:hypothetical protein
MPVYAERRFVIGLTLAAACACSERAPYAQPNELFPVPQGEVRVADWSLALAKAMCSFKERCNDPELTADSYRAESCIEYFRARYEDSIDVAGLVAEGRIAWDPVVYGRCVTREARAGCKDEAPRKPCYAAHGKLEGGDPCLLDAECGPELFCNGIPGCGGRCQRTLPEDGECEHQFQCAQGLTCLQAQLDWLCVPTPKRGTRCSESDSCGPNLHCEVFKGSDFNGSCQPNRTSFDPYLIKPGKACGNESVCAGSTKCRPHQVKPVGEAYGSCLEALADDERCLRSDRVLRSACEDGSYCDAAADLEYGRCVLRLAEGEPCAGEDPHACLEGLSCDSSTCQPMHHARRGEACLSHADCYSGSCYQGACSGAPDCH